mmetsp:Transcript_20420/g.28080  ORF Transcript_20420/g.28080 Transcript_20420/m.28080 type:complete len:450 (+) Transcript_20420:328-1677(+)
MKPPKSLLLRLGGRGHLLHLGRRGGWGPGFSGGFAGLQLPVGVLEVLHKLGARGGDGDQRLLHLLHHRVERLHERRVLRGARLQRGGHPLGGGAGLGAHRAKGPLRLVERGLHLGGLLDGVDPPLDAVKQLVESGHLLPLELGLPLLLHLRGRPLQGGQHLLRGLDGVDQLAHALLAVLALGPVVELGAHLAERAAALAQRLHRRVPGQRQDVLLGHVRGDLHGDHLLGAADLAARPAGRYRRRLGPVAGPTTQHVHLAQDERLLLGGLAELLLEGADARVALLQVVEGRDQQVVQLGHLAPAVLPGRVDVVRGRQLGHRDGHRLDAALCVDQLLPHLRQAVLQVLNHHRLNGNQISFDIGGSVDLLEDLLLLHLGFDSLQLHQEGLLFGEQLLLLGDVFLQLANEHFNFNLQPLLLLKFTVQFHLQLPNFLGYGIFSLFFQVDRFAQL